MKISKLLNTHKTVRTVQQLGQILGISNLPSLRVQLSRRGKQWLLRNLHYGIRSLPNYSTYELANTLKTPSYISLETVLYKEGIVFQNYGNSVFSISDNTKSFKILDTTYDYHKITPKILLDPKWIIHKNWINIASKERAICDRLYLTPWYYFDNLRNISWTKLFEVAEIYQNKRLILDIKQLQDVTQY